MAYEQRENSGSLFKNREKKSSNSPDYTGTINARGELMRISAWLKESKGGVKYLSLSLTETKQDHQNERPVEKFGSKPRVARPASADMGASPRQAIDDEIPFAAEFR